MKKKVVGEAFAKIEDYTKKHEVAELFAVWLRDYTHEVIRYVMGRADEILTNPDTMTLLRELKEREEKEAKDFKNSLEFMLRDYEQFAKYDPHNNALTHANSYRDILYDRYIRDMPREEE